MNFRRTCWNGHVADSSEIAALRHLRNRNRQRGDERTQNGGHFVLRHETLGDGCRGRRGRGRVGDDELDLGAAERLYATRLVDLIGNELDPIARIDPELRGADDGRFGDDLKDILETAAGDLIGERHRQERNVAPLGHFRYGNRQR